MHLRHLPPWAAVDTVIGPPDARPRRLNLTVVYAQHRDAEMDDDRILLLSCELLLRFGELLQEKWPTKIRFDPI